jgi:hypothetical protein
MMQLSIRPLFYSEIVPAAKVAANTFAQRRAGLSLAEAGRHAASFLGATAVLLIACGFFACSRAAALPVTQYPVTMTASCWNSSFPYGGNYQCQVNLSSNHGTPQGSITYTLDHYAPVTVALSGGNAQFTITQPLVGPHTVVIAYAAQSGFAAASPLTENFTVTPAPVNVSLTPTSWYLNAGTLVTFNCSVTSWSAGTPNAIGSVEFYDNGTPLPAPNPVPVNSSGQASYSTSGLTAGQHTITGTYSGANYATGSGTATITVVLVSQTITFSGLPSTATYSTGLSYPLTASASSGLPVTYSVTGPATVSGSTLKITGAGTVTVTASQAGNADYKAAPSVTLTIAVSKATSSTVLTAFTTTPTVGVADLLTAAVSGPGTPTGTVTFLASSSTIAGCSAVPLVSGKATCSYTPSSGGGLALAANYSGDAGNTASAGALTLSVAGGPDAQISLQLAGTTLTYPGGTELTACLTSTVKAVATGTLILYDGTTPLTTQTLGGNGCAYYYVSGLAAGSHSITAYYSGDKNNPSGTSAATVIKVNPVPVAMNVSCWNSTFDWGGNYQCQVSLSSAAGAPQGAVNYVLDNGASVTAGSGSSVSFTVYDPTPGSHQLVISFSPQPNYGTPAPQTESFTVTAPPTITSVSVSCSPSIVKTSSASQCSATVTGTGSYSSSVTWGVNSIAGGNWTVGTIGSSGLYTAPASVPNPATVTITATSAQDGTKSGNYSIGLHAPFPLVVSTSPASNATGVAQQLTISITFNEPLDPGTINPATITFSDRSHTLPASAAYVPGSATVTLLPNGVLEPGSTYAVTVASSVGDPYGVQMGAPYSWSFTAQAPTQVLAVVAPPTGLNPTTLTVRSFGGNEATPDRGGNVTVELRPLGTTLIAAMVPGEPFGLMATTIGGAGSEGSTSAARPASSGHTGDRALYRTRWQVTASPQATTAPSNITVNFQTTAESVLFLTPYFFNADPQQATVIMAAISVDPNTTLLAQALQGAWNEADPLSDPTVKAALRRAVGSIWAKLSASTTSSATSSHAEIDSSNVVPVGGSETPLVLSASNPSSSDTGGPSFGSTPYCWNQSSTHIVSENGLQCLDLDYLAIPWPTYNSGTDQYQFSPTNCNSAWTILGLKPLGCATGWLIRVAPITNPPASGVNTIQAGVSAADSFGPYSPLETEGAGWLSSPCLAQSSCTALVWLPGQSVFQYFDLFGDVFTVLLNAAGAKSTSSDLALDAGTQQSYLVTAYSGGFADYYEFDNVIDSSYADGFPLWGEALATNAVSTALEFMEAVDDGISDSLAYCVTANLQDSGSFTELVEEAKKGDYSSGSGFLATAGELTGTFIVDFTNAAAPCVVDQAGQELLKELAEIGGDFTGVGEVITAVGSIGDIGEAVQHLIELGTQASPVETAIITIGPPLATPPVAGLVDNFTLDNALNSQVWGTSTALLNSLAGAASSPGSSFVAPQLGFSSAGMQMSGVNGGYQFAGIQSLSTLAPPFTVNTTVEGTSSFGNAFAVYLVRGDLGQWVEVLGDLNPATCYQSVWLNYSGIGNPLYDLGNSLYPNPTTNVFYGVQVSVAANGSATVTLTDAATGDVLGTQSNFSVGAGPFYLVLGQREGAPCTAGPLSATWQSVTVTQP